MHGRAVQESLWVCVCVREPGRPFSSLLTAHIVTRICFRDPGLRESRGGMKRGRDESSSLTLSSHALSTHSHSLIHCLVRPRASRRPLTLWLAGKQARGDQHSSSYCLPPVSLCHSICLDQYIQYKSPIEFLDIFQICHNITALLAVMK